MNTVNTKPVRHHFGKVSTEEVRLGRQDGGWGCWQEAASLALDELLPVGSEESAVFSEVTSPPHLRLGLAQGQSLADEKGERGAAGPSAEGGIPVRPRTRCPSPHSRGEHVEL